MSQSATSKVNSSTSVTRKSAVLLGLLTLVQGHQGSTEHTYDQLAREQHRTALAEIPADDLKGLLLSMLQDEETRKVPRPRKPDMRSPLEIQKEEKNKESKYKAAFDERQKLEDTYREKSLPAQALEEYKQSEEFEHMTPFERSVHENRRQREYLLKQQKLGEGDQEAEDAQTLAEKLIAQEKKERKRRKKDKKRSKQDSPDPETYDLSDPEDDLEDKERDLKAAKQEYFEQLRREKELLKRKEAETPPAKEPLEDSSKDQQELTPAQKQKEENARHFEELQELKRAAEGEDYQLPKPVMPESMKFKPSELENEDAAEEKERHHVDGPLDEDVNQSHPAENTLLPNSAVPADDTDDLNRYEKALRENELDKKSFVDELRRQTEEKKQQIKEEQEQKERDKQEKRDFLEKIYYETGEMPDELREIYDEEEQKRQEEEAKRRPEPPTAKSMRERVAEESKRRQDAHKEKMRLEAEAERKEKLKKREEETARRRLEDPNYKPPPPLTVPKGGRPAPPRDYKYPESARKHGYGPPLDEDEEKKAETEQEKKDNDEPKFPVKEAEKEFEEPKKTERHHPVPETKRTDQEPPKQPAKKDKKKKKRKQAKPVPEADTKKKEPVPELAPQKPEKKKKSKRQKKEPEQVAREPSRSPTPKKEKKKSKEKTTDRKKSSNPKKSTKPEDDSHKTESSKLEHQPQAPPQHEKTYHQPHLVPSEPYYEPRKEPSHPEPIQDEEETQSDFPHREERHEEHHHQAMDKVEEVGSSQEGSPELSWPEQEDYDYQEMQEFRQMQPLMQVPDKISERTPHHHHLEPMAPLEKEAREPVHFHSRRQESRDSSFDFSDGREDFYNDDRYGRKKYSQLDRKTTKDLDRYGEPLQEKSGSEYRYRDRHHRDVDQLTRYEEDYRHHRYRDEDSYRRDLKERDYNRHRSASERKARKQDPRLYDSYQEPIYEPRHDDYSKSYAPVSRERSYRAAKKDAYPAPTLPKHDEKLGRVYSEDSSLDRFEFDYGYRTQPAHKRSSRSERKQRYSDLDFSDKELPAHKEDPRHRQYDDSRDDMDFSDMDRLFDHHHKQMEEPSRKRDRAFNDEFERFTHPDDYLDYHQEKRRRHKYDDFDLFKQSYEYESEYDPYRSERRRPKRLDDWREDRRNSRYPHYADYDLDDYYERLPARQQHRRHRSYSDDRYYERHQERPQRRGRRQSDSPRHRDREPLKQTPEEPKIPAQPKQPVQQFFIPSSTPLKEEPVPSAERQKTEAEKTYKKYVPVIRRHGEPLMKMPELQNLKESEYPMRAQRDDYSWSDQAQYGFDYERSNFEFEAESRLEEYPKRHQLLNSTAQGYAQEEDDLAHAIIDTFSQVSQPFLTQEDDNEALSQLAQTSHLASPVYQLLEADEGENKIKMPKFHYTGDGVLKAEPPKTGFSVSSSSSTSQFSSYSSGASSSSDSSRSTVTERRARDVDSRRHRSTYHGHDRSPRHTREHTTKRRQRSYSPAVKAERHHHATRSHHHEHQDDYSHRPNHKSRRASPHDLLLTEQSTHRHHKSRRHQGGDEHRSRAPARSHQRSHRHRHVSPAPRQSESSYSESSSTVHGRHYSESSVSRRRRPAKKHQEPSTLSVEEDEEDFSYESESYTESLVEPNQGNSYDDESSSDDSGEDLALDEEQIVDFFEQTMRLLRKQSHGFNLEQVNGFDAEYEQVKNKLRNGDFLEKQKHVADWEPHAIQPKEPLSENTDVRKVTDYWFQSGTFLGKDQLKKQPKMPFSEQPLSLKELLADEQKLIKDYEEKIRAKEERRKAQQKEEQQVKTPGTATPEVIKPILRKETHKEVDFVQMPQPHSDIDVHFLDQPLSQSQEESSQRQFNLQKSQEIKDWETAFTQAADDYGQTKFDVQEYSLPHMIGEESFHQAASPLAHSDYDLGLSYDYLVPLHEQRPSAEPHYREYEFFQPLEVVEEPYYSQHYSAHHHYNEHNELVPNQPQDNKKKKAPAEKGQKPKSKDMKEEMDYLAHQRLLKDRSMRRKKQKQTPQVPSPHGPQHKPTIPLPSPLKDGGQDEPFDMMAFMKRQRLAKEKEMLEKEKENPNYKPLSPTSHKPAEVPLKDQRKLDQAERKMHKANPGKKEKGKGKDESLVDQINKEKMLREMQKREEDPNYEGPLTPTAKPKKAKKGEPAAEEKEDTIFEQMRRARAEHEQMIRDEDAKRAAEDPTYKPKFKTLPEPDDKTTDTGSALKKRLAEERRKHRQQYEEEFEDDLSEDEDGYYPDSDYYYSEDDEDDMGLYDSDSDSYAANLDYYYDADGFAHRKKSTTPGRFGYGRYSDAYDYHYDPYSNDWDYDGYSDDYDDEDYYSDEYSDYEREPYYGDYRPHSHQRRHQHDDRQKKTSKRKNGQYRYQNELLSDPTPLAYSPVVQRDYPSDLQTQSEVSPAEHHQVDHEELIEHFLARPESASESQEEGPLAPRVPLGLMPKFPKPPQHGDLTELSPLNFSPAKLKKWLDNNKEESSGPALLNLQAIDEVVEEAENFDDVVLSEPIAESILEEKDSTEEISAQEESTQVEEEEVPDEMDELLKEVQLELHTRFKNMFEGDMLLPNLDFNPEFQGKLDANLLSLEELEALVGSREADYLLSLAQEQRRQGGQQSNRLSPFRHWVPRYLRDINSKDEEYHRQNKASLDNYQNTAETPTVSNAPYDSYGDMRYLQ